ncbi:hypothetical protein niasHT_017144 [Heterodera trifolii]|uniref:SET domain-containing protein n=1 Tax=Heterodera trifolii TaxID=157864 RepID=A0ABD2L6Z6_9BILA
MDGVQDAKHDDFLPSLDEIPTAADFVVDNDLSKGKEMNKEKMAKMWIYQAKLVFFKDCLIEWALQTLDDIDAGAPLFEYVGVLGRQKTVGTTADNDDYIVAFEHNGQQYQLDALRKGNLARFVNHSCQPNCCAVLITTAVPIASTATVGDQQHQHGQQQVPSVLVFALRHIFAGEEITLDYGNGLTLLLSGILRTP